MCHSDTIIVGAGYGKAVETSVCTKDPVDSLSHSPKIKHESKGEDEQY